MVFLPNVVRAKYDAEFRIRNGRPLAAYYYLPRKPGQKSVRARRVEPGLVVDFARGGQPIGIEIIPPAKFSLVALNRVLRELGFALLPTLKKRRNLDRWSSGWALRASR